MGFPSWDAVEEDALRPMETGCPRIRQHPRGPVHCANKGAGSRDLTQHDGESKDIAMNSES